MIIKIYASCPNKIRNESQLNAVLQEILGESLMEWIYRKDFFKSLKILDKSVGGVDLEELMRARAELDRERGVETDPDMYNDYGKDHSQPAEPVVETSYEPVQEEPREQVQEEQGYNYNQENHQCPPSRTTNIAIDP